MANSFYDVISVFSDSFIHDKHVVREWVGEEVQPSPADCRLKLESNQEWSITVASPAAIHMYCRSVSFDM